MAGIDEITSLLQHDEHCQVCHREMTLDPKVMREQVEQRIWGESMASAGANEMICDRNLQLSQYAQC
jgi:hypothetical protein